MRKISTILVTTAISFISHTAIAQLSPDGYDKVRDIYKNAISTWITPTVGKHGCFKSYCLGQKLTVADASFGFYGPDEDGNAALRGNFDNKIQYICQHSFLSPILNCKFWRGETAFDQKIKLELMLILDELPLQVDKKPPRYRTEEFVSTARIVGITLSSDDGSNQLFEKSNVYFENLYQRKATYSKQVKDPEQGYSDKCKTLAKSIGKKRTADLTIDERKGIDGCNAESTIAFMAGKYSSTLTQRYTWEQSDQDLLTEIATTSLSNGVPGNLLLKSKTTQIGIIYKNAFKDLNPIIDKAFEQIKVVAEQDKANKKSDF